MSESNVKQPMKKLVLVRESVRTLKVRSRILTGVKSEPYSQQPPARSNSVPPPRDE